MATLCISSSLHQFHSKTSINASSIAVPLPSVNPFFFFNHHSSILPLSFNRYSKSKSSVCSASIGPPPDSDPPPEKQPVLTGFPAFLSKVQDRVQIFFVVLFWMSLFFWTSAWDGRNRPNKGSRFRR